MNKKIDDRLAVVLSSGGAAGAYEVGVMKAILGGQSPVSDFQPVTPGIFTGSSIGAINAAFMVSHLEEMDYLRAVSRLEKFWLENLATNRVMGTNGAYRIRGTEVLNLLNPMAMTCDPVTPFKNLMDDSVLFMREGFERMKRMVSSGKPLSHALMDQIDLGFLISNDPLLEQIQTEINFANIRNSAIELRVSTTNWHTGKSVVFRNHHFTDELGPSIILASGALPGFFSPVKVGEAYFVDAGVVGYAHLAPAYAAGASTVYMIYVDADLDDIPYALSLGTLETLYRMFLVIWSNRIRFSINTTQDTSALIDRVKHIVSQTDMGQEDAQFLLRTIITDLIKIVTTTIQDESNGQDKRIRTPMDDHPTVHHFNPDRELNRGPLEMLNLSRSRIKELIDRGYARTRDHHCENDLCISSGKNQ